MRVTLMMIGCGCLLGMAGTAQAAVESAGTPVVRPSAVESVSQGASAATRVPSSTLRADRPDFHLPFDYRPAHPSDELHRFPGDLPPLPVRSHDGDESVRTPLRG